MYYKIRNDVLFRKYQGHGYITDNSEYGYRMLNDARIYPGEKYVSASGAVMLSMLSKSQVYILYRRRTSYIPTSSGNFAVYQNKTSSHNNCSCNKWCLA